MEAPGRRRGFTIIELMVVVAIIAIAAGLISLALRDPASTRLEREAERLAALLDGARAEARTMGLPVTWQPLGAGGTGQGDGFRFNGLPASDPMPTRWMNEGVSAEVVGAPVVLLGPEATIPAQRIVLRLGDQQVVLGTDGLAPFALVDPTGSSS